MKYMIGQCASVIGMILTVASFQMKTRKRIIIFQTIGSAFFLISYFLLGSWTGVYMNIVYLARDVVFYFREDKKWAKGKGWLYVFLAGSIAAGTLGYKTPIDLLPLVGACFATLAMYMQKENMLRLLNLMASPCWLIYNISLPSSGGIICEAFNIVSVLVGLIRYRKDGLLSESSPKSSPKRNEAKV